MKDRIVPDKVRKGLRVELLVDNHFHAFNAARLKDCSRLFVERMLEGDVTLGVSLSGATLAEAVSWGKADPDHLPDSVVCYADITIALPVIIAYEMAKRKKRSAERLNKKLPQLVAKMIDAHRASGSSRRK